MTPATQDDVDLYVLAMNREFHAYRVRKSENVLMQMIARGLDAVFALTGQGIDGTTFMRSAATTIGPMIAMPDGLSPDDQIEIYTHEIQHVWQFWNGTDKAVTFDGKKKDLPNLLGFFWLYITSGEARARYEANAERAHLEMRWLRSKTIPPTREALTLPFKDAYLLSDGDKAFLDTMLEVAATSVSNGFVSTESGRFGVNWIKTHLPHLVAP